MNQVIKSKIGDCETCDKTGIEIKCWFSNMYQCDECHAKDIQHQSPEAQEARVIAQREEIKINSMNALENTVLKMSREIDSSIQVREQLFNADTVSIKEIKEAIDKDESIVNKPYALANELKNRFEHFKTVVFSLNEQLVQAGNAQRAIQVYLNNLANSLRAEEREQLKIADINYKPNPVKNPTVKKISNSGTSVRKATKADIKKAANELGIPEFTLASFVLMNGGNLEVAVNKLKASIEAAKSVK